MNHAATSCPPLETAAALEAWAFGFAVVRGYATPIPTPTGLWIEIGQADQKGRHILRGVDPRMIGALARSIGAPHVYLEIAATHEEVTPLLPVGWTIRNPAFLMGRPLADVETISPLAAYDVQLIERDAIIAIELHARDGEIAASGMGAFAGDDFIFDKIVTNEAHRRRGLGSAVMQRLTGRATERGARRGLLIATPDGRALYQALGWTLLSPITSVISPS